MMAAIVGGILRLPAVKLAMASQQLRSRYLATMIERMEKRVMPV